MISSLKSALRLGATPRLALVGAGGKTTALFQLAREYDSPVLVANTSHMELWQLALADTHFYFLDSQVPQLPRLLPGMTLLTGARNSHSVAGLSPAGIQNALALAIEKQIPLLIEADGSRRHPVKAPADHEPPIPEFVDTVVVTVGLSALGRSLTSEWVHRPEIFSDLSGSPPGSPILLETVRRVLCHPSGGLKNIPGGTRRVVLLNQADTPELRFQARQVASELIKTYQAVIVTTLLNHRQINDGDDPISLIKIHSPKIHAVYEPVAGIILAAEASSRVSQPNLLLPWQGEPLIRHLARTALQARLSPVLVITGAHGDEIKAALNGLQVQTIPNPEWQAGQSTSVHAGVQAIPDGTGAAVFMLGDQPQVSRALVRALANAHAQTQSPVIAPLIAGRRGNPVLIDRTVFPDLLELSGDAGAHQIFGRYPPDFVPWEDRDMLLDTESPTDYQ